MKRCWSEQAACQSVLDHMWEVGITTAVTHMNVNGMWLGMQFLHPREYEFL